MHLPLNGEQHLATAIIAIINCPMPGLDDKEQDDEQNTRAKAG
jgi:hypothetical protein